MGSWREDYRLAYLVSTLNNIAISTNHDSKKGKPEYTKPIDFILDWDVTKEEEVKETPHQSVEEMKNKLIGISKAFNKKQRRKKSPPKVIANKTQKK